LLARLAQVKPFVLHENMLPAANISMQALLAIELMLVKGRLEMRKAIQDFLKWLDTRGTYRSAAETQKRFTFLRLKFNGLVDDFDLFSDVLTQRSELETGVWLAGLDVLATEALSIAGKNIMVPAVVWLDRGHGAAIRRSRTRLPGGGENPVAIIRIPRERMVGSGIASSLVHECGHQVSATLGLIDSIKESLRKVQKSNSRTRFIWNLWERWIAEILSDLISVARVGVGSTLGLIGVVSLPRHFVFRINFDDPSHHFPFIRVKLSCVMGNALYPHPQWNELAQLWESFYPTVGLDLNRRNLIINLERSIPDFVSILIHHQPRSLGGRSLKEVLGVEEREPKRLTALFQQWQILPEQMRNAPPTLAFAVIGQAKMEGKISAEQENKILSNLLSHWALKRTWSAAEECIKGQNQKTTNKRVDFETAFLFSSQPVLK